MAKLKTMKFTFIEERLRKLYTIKSRKYMVSGHYCKEIALPSAPPEYQIMVTISLGFILLYPLMYFYLL